LVDKIKA
jgi:pre-mRNA-splicing factor RBM22/SLT11